MTVEQLGVLESVTEITDYLTIKGEYWGEVYTLESLSFLKNLRIILGQETM